MSNTDQAISASPEAIAPATRSARTGWFPPSWALGLLVPVAAGLAWESFVHAGLVNGRLVPPPSRIFAALYELARAGELSRHVLARLHRPPREPRRMAAGPGRSATARAGAVQARRSDAAHAGGVPIRRWRRDPLGAWIREDLAAPSVSSPFTWVQRVELEWLLVLQVHLDAHRSASRTAQLGELARIVDAENGRPLLICGDFNLSPRQEDGLFGDEVSTFTTETERTALRRLIRSTGLVSTPPHTWSRSSPSNVSSPTGTAASDAI